MALRSNNTPLILFSSEPNFDPKVRLPLSQSNTRHPKFMPISTWIDGELTLSTTPIVAVVVPMTSDLTKDNAYIRFLLSCASLSAARESFRLYIWLHNMAFSDLVAEAKRNIVLGDLIDTINISLKENDEALSDIDISLAKFLDELVDIQAARKYRKLLLWFFGPFAMASFVLNMFALLCAVAVLVISLGFISRNLLSAIASILALGVGAFLCNSILLTISNKKLRLLPITWGVALVTGSILLSLDWRWIAAGGLLAFTTDHFRRVWISLLPIHLSFGDEPSPSNSFRSFVRLFGGNLWPRDRTLFISYARRTWADLTVKQLRAQLKEMKVDCFLDIESIELGSCWRFALEEGIRRSSLFLFFDQAESDQAPRLWHRAELITASLLQNRTGFPAIAVVTPQQEGIQPMHFYRDRLSGLLTGERFRIIPLSPLRVGEFARIIETTPIRPHGGIGSSDAISDLLISIFFQAPVLYSMIALSFFANLCAALAPLVLPFLIILLLADEDFQGFLKSRILCSVIWLCTGYVLRRSLHLFFEAKPEFVRSFSAINVVTVLLLLPIALMMSLNSDSLALTYYSAFFLLGLVILDSLIRQGKRNFVYGMRTVVNRL